MKPSGFSSISLLWRILLSTSIAITVLFGAVGWILQDQFGRIAALSLEEEARTSFQTYESLWRARADQLASVSLVLSRMPDIRSAFSTGDAATIRDTAQEVWDKISRPGTVFVVCDPRGGVIASVNSGGVPGTPARPRDDLALVRAAEARFPQQGRGFELLGDRLYQIVVTPVYVDTGLLNVLVAGIAVDGALAEELKSSTGGSEFVFLAGGRVAASTLTASAPADLSDASSGRVHIGGAEFYQFTSTLSDMEGRPAGELRVLRSFAAAENRVRSLQTRLVLVWIAAILAGLGFTYLLARRLLRPVAELDRAAAEIVQGNYDVRVSAGQGDEIGRLAETFNSMCAAIREARANLIRQERISTIGRLSTSIVHDLRNPLAAIYGGAEILVDSKLSEAQVRRLSSNIYRASRQIQNLLHELSDVTQGRAHAREMCCLREIVQAAYEPLAANAEARRVAVRIEVPADVELPLDRSPMERVFQNLIVNAIEAMPGGGSVRVEAGRHDGNVMVSVEDDGPGVPEEIVDQIFQPFVTAGKTQGMGLGLALSRKTVLSHGGDLTLEKNGGGAKFVLRLPV